MIDKASLQRPACHGEMRFLVDEVSDSVQEVMLTDKAANAQPRHDMLAKQSALMSILAWQVRLAAAGLCR